MTIIDTNKRTILTDSKICFSADNGAERSEFGVHLLIKKNGRGTLQLLISGGEATRWHKGVTFAKISEKDANYIMHEAQSFNDCLPILLKYSR